MGLIRLNRQETEALRVRAKERADYNLEDRGCSLRLLELLEEAEDRSKSLFPLELFFDAGMLADLAEDREEMRRDVLDRVKLAEGVAIDWRRSEGDAFYVWVLDQIRIRARNHSALVTPEVRLSEAELKALSHFAKTWIFDLTYACDSNWARGDEGSVLEQQRRIAQRNQDREPVSAEDRARHAKIEEDDLEGALEVFGVLGHGARRAFCGVKGTFPSGYVLVEFSGIAIRWLKDKQEEMRASLAARRASVEISGGTRNDTFVLFVLDGIFDRLDGEAVDGPSDRKAVA